MAPTFNLSSQPLLSPLLNHFPSNFSHNSSLSLSKFNPNHHHNHHNNHHNNHHPHAFSLSSPQSLANPQISHLFKHAHLTISPSNSIDPLISSNDSNFIHQKCLALLHLSVLYTDFELVKALHCLILKLNDDNYLLNSLITAYIKLGFLNFAYKVFVGLSSPDVVSYTAIISGFVKFNYEFQGVCMFMRMRERGIEPNEFTFVAILSGCSRINELQVGVQVHSLIVKLGFVFSCYVSNALMAFYSKCGHLDDAVKVFDEMPERDVVSWNTIITSFVSEGMYDQGFQLFREMVRIDGFRASQFTLSSVLSASAGCFNGMLGREVHGYVIKMGFENILSVNNALIGFYAKCGSVDDVEVIFERMPIKDVISWTGMITAYMESRMVDLGLETFRKMPMRNCVSFNAVLAGLCANGEGFKALCLFREMIYQGVELTECTLTSVIKACGLLGEKNISEQIHGFVVKFGFRSNAYIEAALLDMCTRCGRMRDAQKMFHETRYDQTLSFKWTSLISGYARNAQPEEAMTLFKWGLSKEAFEVDEVLATTILGICGALGFYEMGEQMHCYALKLGHRYDVGLGNAIISMYSKCGYMEDAKKVFDLLPVHDVVSWNCLISGHLLLRQGDEVLAVWSRMKGAHKRPDSTTLILVISSYRHTKSNQLDDCRRLFFTMNTEYNIEPTSYHYASFVGVLGYWGYFEEAEDLISKMPFEPKIAVWRALLHSCNIHSESTIGKRIAKRILAMEPEDTSTYILVSNLFSASGRWHCSETVREKMRGKGLTKHPARSWIVHQNAVHSFYTRDRTHSQSKDIYRGLEILIAECLKAGYVPDTSFVLHEVEEQQKKDFLFYHSAKLAVTYGLLTTKPGRPIRVMKNVLLCGDCHNFIKYVSRITRREICVRDTSGFHCFCYGNCSCNDHW